MPRKIEATIDPDVWNLLRDECKRRGRRLHAVAGELITERLTLEAAVDVKLGTPSSAKASPRPSGSRRGRHTSGPKPARRRRSRAQSTEGTEAPSRTEAEG